MIKSIFTKMGFGLAHEIRNPLNNIKLSADHILIDNKDEKQQSQMGFIQRNSERINQIITELLDSTKPFELAFEQHSLQEILEESLAVAVGRINLQKIKLEKSFHHKPLYIEADKSKLKIASTNILINAIEGNYIYHGVQ